MNCRHMTCHSCPDEAVQLRQEIKELREELERTRAVQEATSKLLSELSDTPAEKRVSALEMELAILRAEHN